MEGTKEIVVRFRGEAARSLKRMQREVSASSPDQVVFDALRIYFTLWGYKDDNDNVVIESNGQKRLLSLHMPEYKLR